MNVVQSLVRRARLRLSGQGGFTLTELLVVVIVAGIVIGGLSSAFLVGARTTSDASQRLSESHDAQLVAAYFGPDTANSNYFSKTAPAPWSTCPTTGIAKNIAMFSWKEGGVAKDAFYVRPTSSTTELRRRYCENGTILSDIAVAKNLSATTDPEVTCRPPVGCAPVPGWVTIKVTETSGYSYDLRNTPRSVSSSGGALGGYSVYLGTGGLRLQAGADLTGVAGSMYTGGPLVCTGNPTLIAGGGLYGATAGPACGAPPIASTVIPAQPDPLAELDHPPVPETPAITENVETCHAGGQTFHPGVYTAANVTLDNGCLASGVHYFKGSPGGKITLRRLTAQPGGPLLIFVERGDLDLAALNNEDVILDGLADNEYGNVVVFLHRDNGGTITTRAELTVDGIIYGPEATLDAQTPNLTNFNVTGINVKYLWFHAGGDITVP